MDPSLPPPLPGSASGAPPQPPPQPANTYDLFADKIGGVPNFRKKDNLFQGFFVLVCAVIGAVSGNAMMAMPDYPMAGLLSGLAAGLVLGVLVSGLVLMILGLYRKS